MGADGDVRALRPHPLRGMELTSPDGTCFRGSYRGDRGRGVRGPPARPRCVPARRRAARGGRGAGRRAGRRSDPAGRPRPRRRDRETAPARRRSRRGSSSPPTAGAAWWPASSACSASTGGCASTRCAATGRGSRASREHGEMHVVRGGYCGIAPLAAAEANVTFVVDRAAMHASAGDLEGFYRATPGPLAAGGRAPVAGDAHRSASRDRPPGAGGAPRLRPRRRPRRRRGRILRSLHRGGRHPRPARRGDPRRGRRRLRCAGRRISARTTGGAPTPPGTSSG